MSKIHWKCLLGAIAKFIGGAVVIVLILALLGWLGDRFHLFRVFLGLCGVFGILFVCYMFIKELYNDCVADHESQESPDDSPTKDVLKEGE